MPNDRKKADGQGGLMHVILTCASEDVRITTDAAPAEWSALATDSWKEGTEVGTGVGTPVCGSIPAVWKVPADVKTSITKTKLGIPRIGN